MRAFFVLKVKLKAFFCQTSILLTTQEKKSLVKFSNIRLTFAFITQQKVRKKKQK